MGRPTIVPDVVEKEVTSNSIEVEITPKQAEDLKLIEAKADRPKKVRSEKQIEATKKLIEKNKAWREKLKSEKAAGKPDNMIQGLLAEKADDGTAAATDGGEKPVAEKTKIRYRIKKNPVHPRPNHHLKRKSKTEDAAVSKETAHAESQPEESEDSVHEHEPKRRAYTYPQPGAKKFICMR